ncbi:hypothetical protein [Thiorhodovibrio winogradskyi]|uniref:hypothetical protein n=1 Tax=Thiorhodovibrio winogradskyi TaxID=77007 RepID=UPI002E299C23|nr:hypothetical protein [Thiorhodovibrio winogradskyi]
MKQAGDYQCQHGHEDMGFGALAIAEKNRTDLQEIRFLGSKIAFDLLQVAIALIDRLAIHDSDRHGGFQDIATIQQRGLRQLLLIDAEVELIPLQRQAHKAMEFVTLDPKLQLAQSCRWIGTCGFTDEGITIIDASFGLI